MILHRARPLRVQRPDGDRHRAGDRRAGRYLLGDPPDTAADYVGRSLAILGLATPNFWLATMVIVFPAIWWRWSPPLVLVSFADDPLGSLAGFAIPSLILGTYLSAATMRVTRTMMLEVLSQDYIRTAWSKGLLERSGDPAPRRQERAHPGGFLRLSWTGLVPTSTIHAGSCWRRSGRRSKPVNTSIPNTRLVRASSVTSVCRILSMHS